MKPAGNPFDGDDTFYGKKNRETHERIMKFLSSATPEEIFQTAVSAGIYTPEGELTRFYRPTKKTTKKKRSKT